MPTYGDEKIREIIRGILPSTHRKGARDNARHIHRSHRSAMSQDLRRYRGTRSSDAYEAYDDDATDYEYFPDYDLRYNMWERREGDKLGALMRWGPKLVEDVRLLDRESKLRSILPDSVIGRHALGHLAFLDEISPRYPHEWYYYGGYERIPVDPFTAYLEVRYKLLKLLGERRGHKRFNAYLKLHVPMDYRFEEGDEIRTFRGEHDIDKFLVDCFGGFKTNRYNRLIANGEVHPIWGKVVADYLDLDPHCVNALHRWAETAEV